MLDPMLATGGTLVATLQLLLDRGARSVTALCLLAAPEGVARLERSFTPAESESITVVAAGVDDHLDAHGYIVPGLGDAGDRLFGSI